MSTNDALTVISGDIYGVRETFESVLSDPGVSFEREAGFAIQQLSRNDYSMKIAMDNRQSVVDAVVNIAAIGISLNPAKKQAYLVPRDGRICLDISYIGLLDLAIQSGSVMWGQAELVYEQDGFSLNGFDKPPTHARNPFAKDRGAIVGVYVVVKTADGDYLTTTMQIDEVYDIRDRSSAWKAWMEKKKKCPWVTDEGEMIKKTVIKRAYKLWPKADRLDTAIHHLNTVNEEGLEVIAQENKKLGGIMIPAMEGIGDDMPLQKKQVLEAVASSIIDHFNGDDLVGAYEEYIAVRDNPDYDDEKIWLWKQLPSNIRTALRKHDESLKKPA
jgi:recombination protein RecT